ncbi:MAG: tripartite tricarboxylate transporter substrate binding protein [Burkholderiales bacterium]|nr:tripartite tricarboxylate transporter substrate binding protein [Burkholderiales bacterium]
MAIALGLAAALFGTAAHADEWPSRPIHFIVPFSAGGANDLMARACAEGVAKALHQQVVVENKPGAGTMLGTAFVAKSAGDGYTFLISSAGVVSNSMIRESVPYKDSDLVPVALIGLAPSIIVAPANAPYKDLAEFIAASKAGRTLHFSTAGTGSTPHFVEGVLATRYGAKLDVVPYKSGAESINAVLSGQIDATSEASIVVLPFIKAGKLKALADAWTVRVSAYPGLSTATEQGYGDIRIAHWAGLHAPATTPPAILDRMAAAVDQAMKAPEVVARLKAVGIEPEGGTRAVFEKFIADERAQLGAIVKATKMKAD